VGSKPGVKQPELEDDQLLPDRAKVKKTGVYTPTLSYSVADRLSYVVVRELGYRSGGPGSIPGTTREKVMCLEQGPLSLLSTTEELLDRKVAAPV
jgi:hypothetical protein